MRNIDNWLVSAVLAAALLGCHRQVVVGASPAEGAAMNALTPAEQRDGWTLLFDGHDLSQWRGYRMDSLPTGWVVRDGLIDKTGESEDILTRQVYSTFDLRWDWKIAPGGNAGVFYRATEEYDHIYWSGPEYQLLDDAGHPDGKNRLTAAASDYAVYPSPAGFLHPAGEWNSSEIIVRDRHVEHWLNGHLMVAYDIGEADWDKRVKASKFAAWPHYGRAEYGHIGLQGDHPGELQLRNLRIKVVR
jgi:hypothetical protein